MEFAELFEIVSSPATDAIAECWRLLLAYGGVQYADVILETKQDEADAVASLSNVKSLPVLFDNVACLEIGARLAATQHLAAACGCAGDTEIDRTRASFVAEVVLSWLAAPPASVVPADLPGTLRRLRTLNSILAKFSASGPSGSGPSITYGDLMAWMYCWLCIQKHGAEAVLEQQAGDAGTSNAAAGAIAGASTSAAAAGVPQLAPFLDAVSGMQGVKRYLALKQRSSAAGNAASAALPATSASAAAPPATVTASAPSTVPSIKAVKGPVCVTGASGFIASWIVKLLLEMGYTVHGTVRSLKERSKWIHLMELPFAEQRLRLFEADLMASGSFASAIEGCVGVFHCASPYYVKAEDVNEELIRPAIEGTQNVLRTCISTPSVKRVVVTSSVAAIYVSRKTADHTYTEEDWSDLEYIRDTKQHYAEGEEQLDLLLDW